MKAMQTNLKTDRGETVYDLDPQAGELWAVAGPAGLDPAAIAPDDLPAGCRWIDGDEWQAMQATKNSISLICRDGREADCSVIECDDGGYLIQYPEGSPSTKIRVPNLDAATINAAFAPDWEELA